MKRLDYLERMKYTKGLAILFMIISFGCIRETLQIIYHPSQDDLTNHQRSIFVSGSVAIVMLSLTIWFWIMSKKK